MSSTDFDWRRSGGATNIEIPVINRKTVSRRYGILRIKIEAPPRIP